MQKQQSLSNRAQSLIRREARLRMRTTGTQIKSIRPHGESAWQATASGFSKDGKPMERTFLIECKGMKPQRILDSGVEIWCDWDLIPCVNND